MYILGTAMFKDSHHNIDLSFHEYKKPDNMIQLKKYWLPVSLKWPPNLKCGGQNDYQDKMLILSPAW